jgi:hypothetical protein
MQTKTEKNVWGFPIVLGLLTLFGLLSALLGTGYWYWLSWIAMIIPLSIITRKIWISKKQAVK